MEYKVGDWCVCTNLDNTKGGTYMGTIGHVFQIASIDHDWVRYTKETYTSGHSIQFHNIRHALPKEIPGYIAPSKSHKELKRILKQLKIK